MPALVVVYLLAAFVVAMDCAGTDSLPLRNGGDNQQGVLPCAVAFPSAMRYAPSSDSNPKSHSQFASALPLLTVLINGRDEPRVVFDTLSLFEDDPSQIPSLTTPHDHTPFALAPPSTRAFFAPRPGCGGVHRVHAVPSLLSTSSAEFTTDLVLVLSMARVAGVSDRAPVPTFDLYNNTSASTLAYDTSTSGSSAGGRGGDGAQGQTCFADVLVPGEEQGNTSAERGGGGGGGGAFVPEPICFRRAPARSPASSSLSPPPRTRPPMLILFLYWRGRSNGGPIRGTNYRALPCFRLLELAARAENFGLFHVWMTAWHAGHYADDCDAEPIKAAYNITEDPAPREVYGFKYLLDVDGNMFSGPYPGLLRSGGWCSRCVPGPSLPSFIRSFARMDDGLTHTRTVFTSFTDFFMPWLVPFEHFIPVRPDLADLPAKIEWARANDEEAHHIQQSGHAFAEHVLTDTQNDCHWFSVLLEWGE
ncbi:hypothetical protein B0H17DRAFT_1203215 [Mycena rosella]|uniref:Glycosyl transferase CAP10 domain-containing protein n=1 Tax=Mycena rosella TaxID=1033263 RepID=A0AAD7DCC3_MYCRO|nr:hypothetical protein B0H17DRAFT_1203215 [Mycena rosella]